MGLLRKIDVVFFEIVLSACSFRPKESTWVNMMHAEVRVLANWTQKTIALQSHVTDFLIWHRCRMHATLHKQLLMILHSFSELDEIFKKALDPLKTLTQTFSLFAFHVTNYLENLSNEALLIF